MLAAILDGALPGALILLALPAVALAAAGLAIVAIVNAFRMLRYGRSASGLTPTPTPGFVLGAGLGLALFLPLVWATGWTLNWAHLAVHRGEYRRLASAPAPGPDQRGRRLEHEGVTYIVDAADPRRVAFPDRGGLAGNWSAYVFDPTGRARLAVAGAPPADVKRWFGGDIVRCRAMAWGFYYCRFT